MSGAAQKSPEPSYDAQFVRSLVVFEDDELLALNKPPGLASQGGRGGRTTLEDLLAVFTRSNGKRPSLVHRLDRDTSGVILAAKTKPMAGFLGKALMMRRVRKTYAALVERAPSPPAGVIEAPLRREELGREAYMRSCPPDHPDAEAALTRYRTRASGLHGALLELRPETGRMHQLRVHLAHVERPILGDPRYGGRLTVAGEGVPRLMLHARAIEVPDRAGGWRRFEAPLPADFERVGALAGVAGEDL